MVEQKCCSRGFIDALPQNGMVFGMEGNKTVRDPEIVFDARIDSLQRENEHLLSLLEKKDIEIENLKHKLTLLKQRRENEQVL